MSPNVQETAQSILASRMVWSRQLLDAIDGGKIPAKRINQDTIARLSWHRDSNLHT